MSNEWYGWAWHKGRWHRLTGPHGTIGEAAAELSRVLRFKGWNVPARHQVLTSGPQEPRQLTHHSAQAASDGPEAADGPSSPDGEPGAIPGNAEDRL
jgi:hypothetical protein